MCFSQPDMPPPPPPPPASPPPPLPKAEKAVTQRATEPKKQKRGTQQLTVASRRPTLSMGGGNGGTGVQLSS